MDADGLAGELGVPGELIDPAPAADHHSLGKQRHQLVMFLLLGLAAHKLEVSPPASISIPHRFRTVATAADCSAVQGNTSTCTSKFLLMHDLLVRE
jgi:hypothetical protein